MSAKLLTCTLCGHEFDPTVHPACQSCPLQKGCTLVCCPKCGFEMVDVNQSFLVRLVGRWLAPNPGSLFKNRTGEDSLPVSQVVDRKTGP